MLKLLSLLLAGLLALSCPVAAQTPLTLSAADQAAVQAVLRHLNQNLNDHHFADMAGYVTPDISFVNVVGMFWQGAADVQLGHQAVFDRIYHDAVFPVFDPAVVVQRIIAPDVVLVTTRLSPPNRSDVPEPAGGSPHSLFTTLLVKRQGQWRITFGQNTPVDEHAAAHDPVRMAHK